MYRMLLYSVNGNIHMVTLHSIVMSMYTYVPLLCPAVLSGGSQATHSFNTIEQVLATCHCVSTTVCMYDPIYLISHYSVYSVVQIKYHGTELSFLVPVSEVVNVVSLLSALSLASWLQPPDDLVQF